jgi:hypothetical protein
MHLPAISHHHNYSLTAMKDPSITVFQTSSALGQSLSIDFNAVQRVVQHSFRSSRILVQQIETLENHLHPVRLLRLSDGSRLILKMAPSYSAGLLRHERHGLETEARVLSNLNRYTELPIPRLIKFDGHESTNLLGSPFILSSFTRGLNLQSMQPYLTAQDRQSIDRQLGIFAFTISSQVSPFFGSVSGASSGLGTRSWRETFLFLLESVLRDAEDMLIQLPYDQIRTQMNRLTPCLEDVTEARLVVPNFGNSSNVLIDPDTREISGLLDFSNSLWGDILMAEVFESPSAAFFEGYGSTVGTSAPEHLRKLL